MKALKLAWGISTTWLRHYRWSSYPSYMGEAQRPEFLTEQPILEQVGGRGRQLRERYARYVETGLMERAEDRSGRVHSVAAIAAGLARRQVREIESHINLIFKG